MKTISHCRISKSCGIISKRLNRGVIGTQDREERE
jgi:hypothetical protein